jgi:hypothetical protein
MNYDVVEARRVGGYLIWPVITALPAFLVAFGTSVVLARALRGVQGQ